MYAGVAAYAAVRTPELAGVLVAVASFGALALAVVLWRGGEELLSWSLAPLGAAYVISLFAGKHGALDSAAPLVATALLLCGELAACSLDARYPVRGEHLVRRRALALGALLLAGLAASAVVVAVALAPAGEGLAWTTLGAAAAVAVVGVSVAVRRRRV